MPQPTLGLQSLLPDQSRLITRIRENLESVWMLPRVRVLTSGAPIHLLDERPRSGDTTGKAGSTMLHVLLIGGLVFLARHPHGGDKLQNPPGFSPNRGIEYIAPRLTPTTETGASGKLGSSGGHDSLPPTSGQLLPVSRMVFAAPRVPDDRSHILQVRDAIFDADAPEFAPTVNNPGLPWMKDKNGSNGHGEHGIGEGDKHGMGVGPGDGVGVGDGPGPYSGIAAQVSCRYCPDPMYSDEARKTKLQGRVILRVLVGADGRAKEVQVTHGLGMGLDENAVSAVRRWQFIPANDAARHPVASWITIETVFRLF